MSEREPPRPPRKEVRASLVDSGWTSAPPPAVEGGGPQLALDAPERAVPRRGLPPLPDPVDSPLAGALPDLPEAPFPPLSDPDIGTAARYDDDGDVISSIPPARPLPSYEETAHREPIVTQVDDQIQSRLKAMRDASSQEPQGSPRAASAPPPPSSRAALSNPPAPPVRADPAPPLAPFSTSRQPPAAHGTRSATVMFGSRLPVPPGAPAPPAPPELAAAPLAEPELSPPLPVASPAQVEPPAQVAPPAQVVMPSGAAAPAPFAVQAPPPAIPAPPFETPGEAPDSTTPTVLAAITRRVRFAGGEVPLWSLLSPAVLLIALAAAFIGAAVAGPPEAAAEAGAEPRASSGAAPPAAPDPFEERKDLSKLQRAALGDEAVLKELEAKPNREQSFEEALALAQGLGAREQRKARELRDKLERDPGLAKDAKLLAELRRYVENPQTAPDALAAMARLPGSLGADMLYEIWTGTVGRTAATELAQTFVLSKDVQGKASPALLAALELRAAEGCDAAKAALPRAIEHADRRSLHLLTKLNRRFGCGGNKRQDCYPCLREGDDLERALKAVRARREPRPFGR